MDTLEEQYKQLEGAFSNSYSSDDITRVRKAYEFARDAHHSQFRKDGSPYITHPLAVAVIVAEMGLDPDSVMAALLHDCIEDTPVTYDQISKLFGQNVAVIVDGVTKLSRVTYTSKEEEQMENFRKMLMAMAKDIRVILIKIADRLHNMRTMQFQTEEKQREKSLETMEIYAPIAHRLGMQKIKWELEDLSLLYLDPIGYKEIENGIKERGDTHQAFFKTIQDRITERMNEIGINCTVYGRIKHIYSIYRKMFSQNKQFSEILDLYAFRVIVDDIADCYNVLGHIHDMFKPIPGRFKDYIGTPKPNMYQSLHTTVIGTEGFPFEVQIRTWEMHHTAEYGIAAHWKYKQGLSGKIAGEEKFAWIRRLLESQQDSDAQDFFQSLKVDMFSDEVFVFTPQGDVINLPVGSTPIDFAYNIHSAIGNRMTGATVNGRIVPFNHILQNGDIVEVLTSNSSKGPSRDWLNIVKSSEARNKIRLWFKREKRDENIVHGKISFETELKRTYITMNDISKEDVLPSILKRLSFQSLDDMYAAIGYGGISAQKTVNRIRDELRVLRAEKRKSDPDSINYTLHNSKNLKPIHGILVEGLDNCLVKFSRCCTPVPGDAIVGFITRGYGVSIHRRDCKNYLSKSGSNSPDAGRWINVSWAPTTDEKYQTSLLITGRDRNGLIMDVTTALISLKTELSSISASRNDNGDASMRLVLSVKDRDELGTAIARISTIRGVTEIKRSEN